LTDDQRRAVISFLEVVKGGKEQNKKVNVRWPKSAELHPNLKYVPSLLAVWGRSGFVESGKLELMRLSRVGFVGKHMAFSLNIGSTSSSTTKSASSRKSSTRLFSPSSQIRVSSSSLPIPFPSILSYLSN
jgi:hypothetical protein